MTYKKKSQKDFAQNCDRLEAAELKITLICVALVKFCFGLLLVWFPNPLAFSKSERCGPYIPATDLPNS